MNRLHLGCGKVYLPGWENVDIFTAVKADAYHDITALPYERESFDLIYASHVLEHVHRHKIVATLSHWRALLIPGGILRLAVPSFADIAQRYLETFNIEEVMGLLYGGQNFPLNEHRTAFDATYLTKLLTQSGFHDVRRWDWSETDHAQYDDYSQAYLPHLNREDGRLMSLNMEAVK